MLTSALLASEDKPGIARRLAYRFWGNGMAILTCAAFVFSFTALAVKLISSDIPTLEVVLFPSIFCWLVISTLIQAVGLPLVSPSGRTQACTLMRGLFGAMSLACYYASLEMLPIKVAVTLFFCNPAIAVVLELLVLGQSLQASSVMGCLLTIAGVVLISRAPSADDDGGFDLMTEAGRLAAAASAVPMMGVVLALVAASANAAAFTVVRLIRRRQSALVLTWWYHTVVCTVSGLLLALHAARGAQQLVTPDRRDILLLCVVAVSQLGGHLLLNRGLQLESATRGSAINVLQVLFATLWSCLVLGDRLTRLSLAGGACMLAGVLCIALVGRPPAPILVEADNLASFPGLGPSPSAAVADGENGEMFERPLSVAIEPLASAISGGVLESLLGSYERPVLVHGVGGAGYVVNGADR